MSAKATYYINGVGIISPQKTFDNNEFLPEVTPYDQNILMCIAPEFKEYINPIQLRRLSNLLRTGLSAAIICLRDSNIAIPDGIITATGYGSLKETELYMNELLSRNESQLTPTYFMQGTYNALAGLVALTVKCMGYNNTYVSKGFAFENALQDAILQLEEKPEANFLIGAYDETATARHAIGLREHHYKTNHTSNLNLFESKTPGTIQGEGSAFFLLSGNQSETTWCELVDMRMLFKPTTEELREILSDFLETNAISIEQLDCWISGMSGDAVCDQALTDLQQKTLPQTPQFRFKHLCGEYTTALSFGMWVGASILKKQHIPKAIQATFTNVPVNMNTVLVVNQYMNRNYSMLLLKRSA